MSDSDTRTYTRPPVLWLGDDVDLEVRTDIGSGYLVDVFIRDVKHEDVAVLHLSKKAAISLYHSLGDSTMALNSATIEAAGLDAGVTS